MKATGNRSLVAAAALAALPALLFAGAAVGQEAVSILGMAWAPKPVPALVLSASGPLSFTQARPEPGVVIVEFAEAIPAKPLDPVEAPGFGLRRAVVSGIDEGGRHSARLRLETDLDASVTVAALPSGIEVRVAKSGEHGASLQQAELGDVLPVADGSGVSVHLASASRLEGKAFMLENPPRVVVDLRGVVNRVARRVHPVGTAGIQRVRVSQFATAPDPIVRVVVDLDGALPYRFESNEKGALLRVGAEAPETSAVAALTGGSAAPETAGAAAAPVAVAEAAPAAAPIAQAPVEPKPAAAELPVTTAEKPVATGAVTASTVAAAAPALIPAPSADRAAKPAEAPVVAEKPAPQVAVQAAANEVSAPAPVTLDEPPAKAAAVKIVNEPGPATPEPAPPVLVPVAAAALTAPPASPAQPAKAAKESPWTTSPAAMAEQAAPAPPLGAGAREVESQERRFTGEPISLSLKDADVKDVLRTFAKITGLNVVVDPDVSGSVTVDLENVPWDQCLDIILRINRLDYIVENNVLRVARLDRLAQEKASLAAFKREEEKAKPMRTVTKTLSYAKASAVRAVLTSQGFILSERGSVVVDDRTNQLIIRDAADRIENILTLIDSLDQPNPQVIIEARVVETTRNFSRALGVTWGFTGAGDPQHGTTTSWKFPYSYNVSGAVNLAQPGNGIISMTFGDVLDAFNLDFTLAAAESDGIVKVVSSPKVTAQNNEKAHIQSGILLPIQTVANNTVTVTYVDATLSLDVTPQITAEGTVLLDIDLKKREPLSGINLQGGQNAPISTRDAKTRVMVRDGGTTVIGGIYQITDNDQRNGVPGLNRIPVLGALFRNRAVSNKHDELLIFITPRIVKY
jgi:type IV pilus assembly protein PilQ